MKRATLMRWMTPVACLGVLSAHGLDLKTVEQPWNDNIPFKSCVPAGLYTVMRDSRPSHRRCYSLINEALGIARYPTAGMRDSCLIHIANFPWDVEGCIGPGTGWHPTHWGVSHSKDAMDIIDEWVGGDESFLLEIKYNVAEE